MTSTEAVEKRWRWWRYVTIAEPPIPCEASDAGAFAVRWMDTDLGPQAVDDRYDDNGLLQQPVVQ